MNNLSGKAPGNLSAAANPAESGVEHLVARARVMMLIAALTTALAVGAVVAIIGYRIFTAAPSPIANDGVIPLPKGAHVISTAASAGRVAVLFEINGVSQIRTFDMKTLKQIGRLQFSTEP